MFCLRLAGLIILFLGFVVSYEDAESLHDQYLKEQVRVRTEVCVGKPEYGKCRGNRRLWFYNHHAAKCQRFTYSNCGGNRNRFFSQHACQEFCGKYNWNNPKLARQSIAIPNNGARKAKPA